MTKYQTILLSGILLILTGIFLLASPFASSTAIQYAVTIGMIASSAFAWLTTYKSKNIQLPFKYHELHAVSLVAYSIIVLIFATNLAKFLNITTCFFIYYGTAELIFCFQLLNHKGKISIPVILLRSFIALVIYSGALFIINTSLLHPNRALQVAGIMFIISGLNMFLYKTILLKMEIPEGNSRTV
jgi:uncharacterized membrane protein HdeD (DUF308 family)